MLLHGSFGVQVSPSNRMRDALPTLSPIITLREYVKTFGAGYRTGRLRQFLKSAAIEPA